MSVTAMPPTAAKSRSRLAGTAARILRHPVASASIVTIVLFVVLAITAPWVVGDPNEQDYATILDAPSLAHIFGTDDIGRDVLTRAVFGIRTSLTIALISAVLSTAIAVPLGAASAYFGGVTDLIVSRLVDVMFAFPYVIFAIILAVILGPSMLSVVIALSMNLTPMLTRIMRSRALVIKELGYIDGAILDGAGKGSVLFRQIVPNMVDVIIVQMSLVIPFAIIGESLLSFLGAGVSAPTATWGTMLASAQPYLGTAPWLAIFPGLFILVAALAFNLLGDVLRDELDPTTRGVGA